MLESTLLSRILRPAELAAVFQPVLDVAGPGRRGHYYEGLIRQKAGESEAAVAALETAVEEGYSAQLLAADPQLAGLRAQAGFQRITGKAKAR